MNCVNRDMRAIGTTEDDVHETGPRRIVSAVATPQLSGINYKKKYVLRYEIIIGRLLDTVKPP